MERGRRDLSDGMFGSKIFRYDTGSLTLEKTGPYIYAACLILGVERRACVAVVFDAYSMRPTNALG